MRSAVESLTLKPGAALNLFATVVVELVNLTQYQVTIEWTEYVALVVTVRERE